MPGPTRTPPTRTTVAPAIVHDVLASAGAPLPADIQTFIRPRLAFDPAAIRVHTDANAAAAARSVGARAFAVGRHIAFAAGAYAPHTLTGRRLLDHELHHAAEQQGAPVPARGALEIADHAAHEHTAELAERGAWSDLQPLPRAVLQRKLDAAAEAVLPGIRDRVRARLDDHDLRGAFTELKKLPPGAGPDLARLDPDLRARFRGYNNDDGNVAVDARFRLAALAILSGAALDAAHVHVAAKLLHSQSAGGRALLRRADTTKVARDIETAFDKDLGDAFPDKPTLLQALGVRSTGFFLAGIQRGLLGGGLADPLHAVMLLDHQPSEVELAGLRLAKGDGSDLADLIRFRCNHGDNPAKLDELDKEWDEQVRDYKKWQRPGLLTQPWHFYGLEKTVETFLDEGPRLQIKAYFDALRARRAEQAADASYAELKRLHGLHGARIHVADQAHALLSPYLDRFTFLGRRRVLRGTIKSAQARIFELLRYLPAPDLRIVNDLARSRHGTSIGRLVRQFPIYTDDFFSILGLIALGTHQRPAVSFASAIFRDEPLEALNVLYNRAPYDRQSFHADYQSAYFDLLPHDNDVADYRHVKALFSTRWKREKLSAALEATLTKAEELYFVTVAIKSPTNAEVGKLLDDTRSSGTRTEFHKLVADWNTKVRAARWWNAGQPLTPLTMREALRASLSGKAAARAENLFQQFGEGLRPGETGAAIDDLVPAIRLFEVAIVEGDVAQIKREIEVLGKLIAELRRTGPNKKNEAKIADAERKVRVYLDYRVKTTKLSAADAKAAHAAQLGGGKLRDADDLFRHLALGARDDNKTAALAALKIVTSNWAKNNLATLEREAKTPLVDTNTGKPLRDPYSLADLNARSSFWNAYGLINERLRGIFERIQLTAKPGADFVTTGAARLYAELYAPQFESGERLAAAFDFLGDVPEKSLELVLLKFVVTYLSDRRGNPAERFVDYLVDDFGLAKTVPAIAEKVRAKPVDPRQQLTRARFVEASRHTGVIGDIGGWLAAKVGGRDVGPAIQQAIRNLEGLTRDMVLQPNVADENVKRNNKNNVNELGEQFYNDVKTNVDLEHQLKEDFAKMVEFAIEIGVRAALVGVFGPASLTGIIIGLTTVGGARLVTKGLLGANTDLASQENIASLVTELSGGFYEAIKLEDRIAKLAGYAFKKHPFMHKLTTGALNKVSTSVLDGMLERAIQQTGAPDLDKICGVIAGSLGDGLGKALGDKLSFNVTSFNKFNERWLVQVGKQFLAGPPPKAAAISSGLATLIKVIQDLHQNGRDNLDIELLKTKFREWAIGTVLTAPTVATAFTANKHRDAKKRVDNAEKHAGVLADLAHENTALHDLLRDIPPEKRGEVLLKLARDPKFGREKIAKSDDPNAPINDYAGENQRRVLDEILKNLPEDGKVPDNKREKAVDPRGYARREEEKAKADKEADRKKKEVDAAEVKAFKDKEKAQAKAKKDKEKADRKAEREAAQRKRDEAEQQRKTDERAALEKARQEHRTREAAERADKQRRKDEQDRRDDQHRAERAAAQETRREQRKRERIAAILRIEDAARQPGAPRVLRGLARIARDLLPREERESNPRRDKPARLPPR